MMKKCETCRFWSQMVAQCLGGGPVEALCLAEGGPRSGKYMSGYGSCPGWKDDRYGKVDDPPNYGQCTRPLYEADEGADAFHAASVPMASARVEAGS